MLSEHRKFFLAALKESSFQYQFFSFHFVQCHYWHFREPFARFTLTYIDLFYSFSPTHCRVICNTFIFQFSIIFPLLNTVCESTTSILTVTVKHLRYLGMLCCASGHQVLHNFLPREAEDIPRAGKYPKHMPPLIYLVYVFTWRALVGRFYSSLTACHWTFYEFSACIESAM